MRSGFVAILGRPNVGKSTLVNAMVGAKVSIMSSRPNTTRHNVRGIVNRPDVQMIVVDTPGLHRPRTALGERLVETAGASLADVDVVVAVVDATAAIGPGDRMVLAKALETTRRGASVFVVVNKMDVAKSADVLERLATVAAAVEAIAAESGGSAASQSEPGSSLGGLADQVEYFPMSAMTGEGVAALLDAVADRLPEGPAYYPTDITTDTPEAIQVAELVREQLLRRAREELPHSIACRVTEWEWPRIRCEIVVERDSQKGIVIGRGGEVLKAVGTEVRKALPPGAFLELYVRVEKRWQQRDDALDRLGY